MAELVAMPLDNGGVIVAEMDHAEAGAVKAGRPVITKAASGCHVKVTLCWDRDRDDDAPG